MVQGGNRPRTMLEGKDLREEIAEEEFEAAGEDADEDGDEGVPKHHNRTHDLAKRQRVEWEERHVDSLTTALGKSTSAKHTLTSTCKGNTKGGAAN